MAKVATKAISGNYLTISFVGGETLECDLSRLTPEIVTRLAMHGLSQKVGDSYASAESVTEAAESARAQWDGLLGGEWATRSGGGILAAALSRATGKELAECVDAVRRLDDKQKRKLSGDARILTAIAEIRKERAGGSTIDLAAMF